MDVVHVSFIHVHRNTQRIDIDVASSRHPEMSIFCIRALYISAKHPKPEWVMPCDAMSLSLSIGLIGRAGMDCRFHLMCSIAARSTAAPLDMAVALVLEVLDPRCILAEDRLLGLLGVADWGFERRLGECRVPWL